MKRYLVKFSGFAEVELEDDCNMESAMDVITDSLDNSTDIIFFKVDCIDINDADLV